MTAISPARATSVRLAALVLVLGSALISPSHVAAQLGLGSLIVTVTAPQSGSTVSGPITVSASVSIVGSLTVRDVQFRLDGANLGAADSSAPYAVPWDTRTATNGTHTLVAIARDLLGVTYASNPVTVTVFNDLTPPTVAITAPAAGATVAGTITIGANASDNVAVSGVQFRLDGVNLGTEDTAAPYSAAWNTTMATNGTHTITAVARDAAGNVATSSAVTVTVDNARPSVSITAPASGATLSGTVTVAASASDNVRVAGVQFRLDGANLGAEDTSAPYSVPWNTKTASDGSHTLTAVARDGAGNLATSPTVTVTVDNTGPSVAITSPAPGATVAGSITVTANASDASGVAGVQFRLDGASLGAEDTAAPYSVAWDTASAANGTHTLTAVARDSAGQLTTSAAVTVTVNNTNSGPTIAITSPPSGATLSGTVTLSADASDADGVGGVQFQLDGASLGAEDTAPPYSVVWDTGTATNGTHTLTTVARDALGNTTTASPVTVTVSNGTASVARVEDTSASVVYVGSWAQGNTAKAWSGGTAALATGGPSATGEPTRATLTFTGTGVQWIGFQGPQTGIANVYLDGAFMAAVDTYAATEALGAVLYTASGLVSTSHTLTIDSTGTRNPSSSDIFVVVDAFDITAEVGGGGPDTTPPSVAISAPAAGASVSGNVTVSATASDDDAIAGVQFQLDGAPVGAEDTTTPYSITWDTTTVADGSHTLTAIARDAAGNTATSAAVTVTVANHGSTPPSSTMMTRFENTDTSIVYTPGSAVSAPPNWWHGSRSRGWSGETSSFNRSEGARATFTFTGTSVAWIGFRASWAGIARVYLDGAFAGELDLYASAEEPQARVYAASGLAAGTHTLVVECTGRKNLNATDNAVVVDAFDVGPAVAPPAAGRRIEDTSSSMTFTAGWTPAPPGAWSGGSAAASSTAGARATVAFAGTSVSLVGLRGPQTGIARVYLDGAFHSTIDTFSSAEIQAVVFTDTNLAPGNHQLAIEVTGTKNAAATNHLIVLDAFDVRSRFEEVDPAVRYTGAWVAGDFSEAWSGTSANFGSGSAARATAAGARAEFSFSGTSVTWVGYRGPQSGIARVHVDGAFISEVDTYAATAQVQAPLFTASGLPAGPHVLAIEVTGLKNAASSNAVIVVDAFDVTLPATLPTVRRFQESDAAYPAAGWTQSSPNPLYSGTAMAFSSTPATAAEFTFTGSGIRWIGQRAFDGGVARVYVDGVVIADLDTYAPIQEEYQAVIFSAGQLGAGPHTIRIEVAGTKNVSSSGIRIVVDAFEVIQ